MRKKRRIPLENGRINKYLNLPEYFETPPGQEILAYIQVNKPLVFIFLTQGGYVVDVEIKKFTSDNIQIAPSPIPPPVPTKAEEPEPVKLPKPKEVSPNFQRPPDPIDGIMDELDTDGEEPEDSAELQIGAKVKYKKDNIPSIGQVIEINGESSIKIEDVMGGIVKVTFDDLISIVQ